MGDADSDVSSSGSLTLPVQILLAFIAGAAYPLAFAPFNLWPLTFASAAVLFWLLSRAEGRMPLIAWVFGLGKYAAGVSWIYVSIHQYGGASPLLAGIMVAVFVAFMALFCLPIGWFLGKLKASKQNISKSLLAMGFVATWVLMEWTLTWFLTGFPWLFAGHAMLGTPLQSYAPIVGTLGISLVVLTITVAVMLSADQVQPWKMRLAMAGVVVVLAGLGVSLDRQTWTKPSGRYEAALVQGNIDQTIKWDADQRLNNVRKHMQLSEDHWDTDVLIWPEFALTLYGQDAVAVTDLLNRRGKSSQTNVVIGMPDVQWQDQERYQVFNSAQGFGQASGKFAKYHLVPFGDYVPLQHYLRGFIEFFDLPMSKASRGARQQANIALTLSGQDQAVEVAAGICYEIAYGDSLRRQAETSGLLLTISNDTWFGGSIGPHQHMQIAQMRALENGRWLLRGTNNGVTGIVNPRGEITAQLPQFEPNVLQGEFEVMAGLTPYSRLGDIPALTLLTILLVVTTARSRRRNFS
jgi:apolipoprotein N-acyltransferase